MEWGEILVGNKLFAKGTEFIDEPVSAVLFFEAFGVGALFKAAKELYITQPSLSHAIKSLETELGVQLFEREGRRMRLTPFGKEFAIYVKRGLREIDKGVELAQEFNGKLGGTVNVGAVLTVQGDYLPPLFHDFSENYGQEVKLNMFQGFSIPLVEGLENDKYDVVFAAAGSANRTLLRACFPMNW